MMALVINAPGNRNELNFPIVGIIYATACEV